MNTAEHDQQPISGISSADDLLSMPLLPPGLSKSMSIIIFMLG
jgi:hypothetical protein